MTDLAQCACPRCSSIESACPKTACDSSTSLIRGLTPLYMVENRRISWRRYTFETTMGDFTPMWRD